MEGVNPKNSGVAGVRREDVDGEEFGEVMGPAGFLSGKVRDVVLLQDVLSVESY